MSPTIAGLAVIACVQLACGCASVESDLAYARRNEIAVVWPPASIPGGVGLTSPSTAAAGPSPVVYASKRVETPAAGHEASGGSEVLAKAGLGMAMGGWLGLQSALSTSLFVALGGIPMGAAVGLIRGVASPDLESIKKWPSESKRREERHAK